MDNLIYFLLSVIDSFVVLSIMFKLFRIPLFEYIREVLICTVIISIASYIIRILIEAPGYDPIVQAIIYLLWLRYVIKFRLPYAKLISVTGLFGAMAIQLLTYMLLLSTGIVDFLDAQESTGMGTYLIQIFGQVTGLGFAFFLYRFNYGFSFISRPPHDMFIKDKVSVSTIIILVIGNIILYSAMFWILNNFVMLIIPLVIAGFAILFYISYKKDNDRDRRISKFNRL